jgi:polyisoprenoid-binding protein YceI
MLVASEPKSRSSDIEKEQDMATERFTIDLAHSGIHFTVRHMVIAKVRGSFLRWSGTIVHDDANPSASSVEVDIETASVDTREPKRDEHLRSADFLDVANYPTMTFKSTAVEKRGPSEYVLLGDLTLHGVTRKVELEVDHLGRGKDPWGGERIAFQAKTTINRTDYGLKFNVALETGGVLVGEKVEISLDVEAVKVTA